MSSVNSVKSFIKNSHTVGINEYHFEWCPKYRYKCMKKEYINKQVEKFICQAAKENRILIKTMAIGFDHIHMNATIPFDMSPSEAMGKIKGRSAYLIFRRFPNFRKLYRKGHFWSRGKFFRSISNVTSGAIKNYIENQQFDKLHETVKQIDHEPAQLNLTQFF